MGRDIKHRHGLLTKKMLDGPEIKLPAEGILSGHGTETLS
jgi:hypothetical protein